MPGSYERIHYGLRPAKAIERKMLCEAFQRLAPFGAVKTYRYIGFGSTYFSDFILLHKTLGISNMISLERDIVNKERFLFNRPFGCVRIKFGESNDILPALNWNVRTILWLDYDGKLDGKALADVKFACASTLPGSVVIVTVNAQPEKAEDIALDDLAEYRLQRLIGAVGKDKVPLDVEGKHLNAWGTATISRRIILNQIQETLTQRNGGRDPGSRILFNQLFHFRYADGAKMLTVGGILIDEGQTHLLNQCAFNNLSFIETDEEPYLIEAPNLTYREIRHLDAQLPCDDIAQLRVPAIPQDDVMRYTRVYRYFPTFAETEA